MPSSFGILPEGAPATLFEFFKKNPGSTIAQAFEALGMRYSNAYYALAVLKDKGLIKRFGRKFPARWETVSEVVEDPLAAAPPAIAAVMTFSSPTTPHPTGTPYSVVEGRICPDAGELQVFAVAGAQLDERNYSRAGNVNTPGAEHPWAWGNYSKPGRA